MCKRRWGPGQAWLDLYLLCDASELHPEASLLPARSPNSYDWCLLCINVSGFPVFLQGAVRGVACHCFPQKHQLLHLQANTRGVSPHKLHTVCLVAGKKQHFCLPLLVAGKSPWKHLLYHSISSLDHHLLSFWSFAREFVDAVWFPGASSWIDSLHNKAVPRNIFSVSGPLMGKAPAVIFAPQVLLQLSSLWPRRFGTESHLYG